MTFPSKPTETGEALKALLSTRGVSQIATATATGASQAYLSEVANGKKLASAGWLDTVASALALTDEERIGLHRAAARDHGFRIDLT